MDDETKDKPITGSGVEQTASNVAGSLSSEAERANQIVARARELADKWMALAQAEVSRVKMVREEWDLLQHLVERVKNMTHEDRVRLSDKIKEMGAM